MNFLSAAATFYKEGGIFMNAVLVIAVLIVAMVVERMIVIGRATGINGGKLTDDLVRRVTGGDLAGARDISSQSDVPLARVAQAMLEVGAADEETLQSAADDAGTLALPQLTRRLPHLGVLANSATLIGLLGTITGLITAISGVGVADAAQRSAYLSAGISEALHTTAFGLMIAIPTLLIQGWLNGRVEAIAQDIDQLSIRLSKALAHAGHGGGLAPHVVARPVPAALPVSLAEAAAHPGNR
ncbi:MAG: MotA/TolQ/ExbB proton channel family protein [Candidatus Eisenbacteria bacterium]|uniref:MotA/TolQ/ExbB proton channel family protein n=1 Tax=Eiseniibacteriota bacterium TaxID=2212470 RepID=A0A538TUA5_UNCEI|nr:MAG: MotA/TolQ/ExbB proton channel family protein [Candidatus Eisenbacteria bacterium]